MAESVVDIAAIEKQVTEWSMKTFGNSFVFRKYQKEACVEIIRDFLSGTKNYILEAPTGSGKSIIAMIIGGVLSTYYDKTGYVLISDLSLIQQYERDIDKYLPKWGCIKGQDNYNCTVSGLPFKMGECQLQRIRDYTLIKESFKECAPTCPYIVERDRAIAAPVTVCTYHHWFTHQNMTSPDGSHASAFGERDFIICDEAHKLVDIIQSMYSIRISDRERNFIDVICSFSPDTLGFYRNEIQECFDELIAKRDDYESVVSVIKSLNTKLNEYGKKADSILKESYNFNASEVKRLVDAYKWISDFDDVSKMFTSSRLTKNDVVATYTENPAILVLNCLNEEYLVNRYFFPHFSNCLYMSATIGDPDIYAKNANIRSYHHKVIDSTFDFSRSPIYIVPDYKMDYQSRDKNLPYIIQMVEKILDTNVGLRGCILTSSYAMAKAISDGVSAKHASRIMLYSDSKGKREVIDRFKHKSSIDMVIIGPSLFDGLSFDYDLCRFLVIAKVPYPDLSSKFVKKKMEKNHDWYASQAALSIVQGVGRGVRAEDDWCVSYILDGCFPYLLRQTLGMFNTTISNRFRLLEYRDLINKI